MTDLCHWQCENCGAPNDTCDDDVVCCDDPGGYQPREFDPAEDDGFVWLVFGSRPFAYAKRVPEAAVAHLVAAA